MHPEAKLLVVQPVPAAVAQAKHLNDLAHAAAAAVGVEGREPGTELDVNL